MAGEQNNWGQAFGYDQDNSGHTPDLLQNLTDDEWIKYLWHGYLNSGEFQTSTQQHAGFVDPLLSRSVPLTSEQQQAEGSTQFGTETHVSNSFSFIDNSSNTPGYGTHNPASAQQRSAGSLGHFSASDGLHSAYAHDGNYDTFTGDSIEELMDRSPPSRTSHRYRETPSTSNAQKFEPFSYDAPPSPGISSNLNVDEIHKNIFKESDNGIDQSFMDHLCHERATNDIGWEEYFSMLKESIKLQENPEPLSGGVDCLDDFTDLAYSPLGPNANAFPECEMPRSFNESKQDEASYDGNCGASGKHGVESRTSYETTGIDDYMLGNKRHCGVLNSGDKSQTDRKTKPARVDNHGTSEDKFARNLRRYFQKEQTTSQVPLREHKGSYANVTKQVNVGDQERKRTADKQPDLDFTSSANENEREMKDNEPNLKKCAPATSKKSDFDSQFARNLRRHYASSDEKSKGATWEAVDGRKKKTYVQHQEHSTMGLSDFSIPKQPINESVFSDRKGKLRVLNECLEGEKDRKEDLRKCQDSCHVDNGIKKKHKSVSDEKVDVSECDKEADNDLYKSPSHCPETKVPKGREKLPKESGLKGPYRRRKVGKKSKASKPTESTENVYRSKLSSQEMESVDTLGFIWELLKWFLFEGKVFSAVILSRTLTLLSYLLLILFLVVYMILQGTKYWGITFLGLFWRKFGAVLLVKCLCYMVYIWLFLRRINPGGLKEKIKDWWRRTKEYFTALIWTRKRGGDDNESENTFRSQPSASTYVPTTGEDEVSRLLEFNQDSNNPYRVLGVDEDCSNEEIKRQYKRLAVLVHPDKNPHSRSGEAFQVLSNANHIIGDPEKRRGYEYQRFMNKQQESDMNDFHAFVSNLEKMMMEAKQYMHCDHCESKHKKYLTEKKLEKARYCAECGTHHYALDGDVWAESKCLGMKVYVYTCIEGEIYDISEWAKCQGLNPKADTHHKYGTMKFRSQPGNSQHSSSPRSNPLPDDWSDLLNQTFNSPFNDERNTYQNNKTKKRSKRKKKR